MDPAGWPDHRRSEAENRALDLAEQAALQRARVPLDRAEIQNKLGNALQTIGMPQSGTACLEEAVAAYDAALAVFIPAGAHTQHALHYLREFRPMEGRPPTGHLLHTTVDVRGDDLSAAVTTTPASLLNWPQAHLNRLEADLFRHGCAVAVMPTLAFRPSLPLLGS